MKTTSFKNRFIAVLVSASVAAFLMLGLSSSRTQAPRQDRISAHHAVQVADGSESNGGKGGGKGGAKLVA